LAFLQRRAGGSGEVEFGHFSFGIHHFNERMKALLSLPTPHAAPYISNSIQKSPTKKALLLKKHSRRLPQLRRKRCYIVSPNLSLNGLPQNRFKTWNVIGR